MEEKLTDFHGHFGGVRWKLTADGVSVESIGVERTSGAPTTVTNAWVKYSSSINKWSTHNRVCAELILATMCTETNANPSARRNEPGWTSDEATPSKVSIGLMQTLISTARHAVSDEPVNTAWLLVPDNSIRAGAGYIASQASATRLDPPLVACAYNAGGLYSNGGSENRWKLRQYPINKGEHCDRFVKWFNDAVFVLKNHPQKPAYGFATFLQEL